MERGFFLTFEGPEAGGKSTQIGILFDRLKQEGFPVIKVREPGSTPVSERIRELLLDKRIEYMDPMTEVLLFSAARSTHVSEVIGPALEEGKIVISDKIFMIPQRPIKDMREVYLLKQ